LPDSALVDGCDRHVEVKDDVVIFMQGAQKCPDNHRAPRRARIIGSPCACPSSIAPSATADTGTPSQKSGPESSVLSSLIAVTLTSTKPTINFLHSDKKNAPFVTRLPKLHARLIE
jgi:hypothetical protein